jgi:hypothetical protein
MESVDVVNGFVVIGEVTHVDTCGISSEQWGVLSGDEKYPERPR